MGPDSWYYAAVTGPVGPFTREQIEALASAGAIASDTLVRQSDSDLWVALGEVIWPANGSAPATDNGGSGGIEGPLLTEPAGHRAEHGDDARVGSDNAAKPVGSGAWGSGTSLASKRNWLFAGGALLIVVAAGIWFAFLRGPDECVAVFESDFPVGNTFYGQAFAAESEGGLVGFIRATGDSDAAFAAYLLGPGKEAGNSILLYPEGTRAVVERVSFYDRLSDPFGPKIRLLHVRIEDGPDEGRLVWVLRDAVDVPDCDYI